MYLFLPVLFFLHKFSIVFQLFALNISLLIFLNISLFNTNILFYWLFICWFAKTIFILFIFV